MNWNVLEVKDGVLMKEVCILLGINKTRTCSLHPRGDGYIERFNRTLISMVVSLLEPEQNQRDWDERLPYAMPGIQVSSAGVHG